MKFPDFEEEIKLKENGFENVVGLDEAGRGPLAGPIVAAAVLFKSTKPDFLKGINDSKKLSAKKRNYFYNILISHKDVEWGIGIVSEKVIDKINILEATKLAMQKAIFGLKSKPGFLLLDGNFKIKSDAPQKSIIKGDQKVFSISAASIIAKVKRDKIMDKFGTKFPQYGFEDHKGYGTKKHYQKIKEFGPCKIHRRSFRLF